MRLRLRGFSNPYLAPYTSEYAQYLLFIFTTFGSDLHLKVLQENTSWFHSQIPYRVGEPQPDL